MRICLRNYLLKHGWFELKNPLICNSFFKTSMATNLVANLNNAYMYMYIENLPKSYALL